ncbi:hypothetical protein M569_15754, partial [Genlisea aurea]
FSGNNGTIDGQGWVWWEKLYAHSLNYSRPDLVELISSDNIVVSNLTFLNAPAWNIHPVYCRKILVQNITVYAPPDSPKTSGIVPDSSEYVCIERCNVSTGYDAVVLKSGWDEYGISYGKPAEKIRVQNVDLRSSSGSGFAVGSEMSGGISNVTAKGLRIRDSFVGIQIKTGKGRGGYVRDVLIRGSAMENVKVGIKATGKCAGHPDDLYDPDAIPSVEGIAFRDIVGTDVATAGVFSGISGSPFTSIRLDNVSLSANSSWTCDNVAGSSADVVPEPCPALLGGYGILA